MGRGHAYSQSENSLAVTTGLGLNQSAVLVKQQQQQQQHSALRIYLRSSERPTPGHEFFFFLYNNKNCIEEHGDKQGWRARSTKRFTTERTRGNGARV